MKVTLIQGLPKQDKLEWVIQKAIELGVTEIRPAIMDHSVVKVDPAKAAKKQERWQKIAEAAAKQSKRDIIPQVALPAKFRDIVTQCPAELKIVAYEVEDTRGIREVLAAHRDARSIAFLIGPEGGISKDEFALTQELGWHSVSLGPDHADGNGGSGHPDGHYVRNREFGRIRKTQHEENRFLYTGMQGEPVGYRIHGKTLPGCRVSDRGF